MASLACAILCLVLVSLAAVQYRWIAELREAERRQLEFSLKTTADHFAEDFVSELLRVVTAFQLEYRSHSELLADQLKDAHEQWVGSAPHLAVIRAAAYNLEEGVVEDRSQVRHYAGVVQDAGRRLSKMVDQILLFADTQSWRRRMTFTAVNVGDVVEKALEGVSAVLPSRGSIEKVLPPDLPRILADPELLSHCIENLVINALKYGQASDSKPVTISAEVDKQSEKMQIRVVDRGPGIDPIDLPHIFKPFYRGKNADLDLKGAGLGLALVQRLIHCQRGHVSVQTTPRHGSTFTISIPIAA